MSRHPEVKWAETTEKIFLTVVLADSKDTKVNLEPEGVFNFSAKAGPENHVYELKLELHDKVNVEESKINVGERNIFCILEKVEPERWNKLLRAGKPPHYVKVDWEKWVDEDDEGAAGAGDMDMGGMEGMGGMGGMGGMPGMGGMGGMPGMGGMDFSNLGGMGGLEGLGGMGGLSGMPGLEGLGGMGGMGGMGGGGMGGMDDFEDSDDEAQSGDKKDDAVKEEAPATEKAKAEEQTASVKEDK